MLATVPQPQLEARLRALLTADPAKAKELAKAFLQEHALQGAEGRSLVARRIRNLAAMGEREQRAYLAARFAAGREVPQEVDIAEMKSMEDALATLPPDQRQEFLRTKAEVLRGLGLQGIPPQLLVSARGIPYHHDMPMDLKVHRGRRYQCAICGFAIHVGLDSTGHA